VARSITAGLPRRVLDAISSAPTDLEPYVERARRIEEACEKEGIEIITAWSACYPNQLRGSRTYGPIVLFVNGNPDALCSTPGVAIVGTRHPSKEGADRAFSAGTVIAGARATVVSGLALGIDAAAHRGSLSGGGTTIAVLGRGAEKPYPRENTSLYLDIKESQGAIVSEYPPGTPPSPERLRRRNRLIVSLALCVVIAECPIDSGAMIAARAAVQQGRPLAVLDLSGSGDPGHRGHRSGTELLSRTGLAARWSGTSMGELEAAIGSHALPTERALNAELKNAHAGVRSHDN
jgi:DNA processing protein